MDTVARKPYLAGPLADGVLVLYTPFLIGLAFLGAAMVWPLEQVAFLVATVGSAGHHLPGMMRAYGDRQLFSRYRARFILAPLFLVAVSIYFTFNHLAGLGVVLLLWGFWHGMAQIYGFARIYDAKLGYTDRRRARLDFALLGTWFGAGIIFSDTRLAELLAAAYQSGMPPLDAAFVTGLRSLWGAATACVTLAYGTELIRQRKTFNKLKITVLVSSISFWCFAMLAIKTNIISIALFELFHDVQYLTIVWIFNRRRALEDENAGAFTRFLFRPRVWLVGLYLALIAAYGFVALFQYGDTIPELKTWLIAFFSTSTLLHFYYDGFIWKLRQQPIRKPLDIKTGGAAKEATPRSHLLKWGVLAALLALLAFTESLLTPDHRVQALKAITQVLPDDAETHYRLGEALEVAKRPVEAIGAYAQAAKLRENHFRADMAAARLHEKFGGFPLAIRHLEHALAARPGHPEALTALLRVKAKAAGLSIEIAD